MSVDVATRRGAREGLVASKPVTDDAAAYINRVRAEIEAEAELRRRRDPALQRREREIERAWVEIAPPGAAGPTGARGARPRARRPVAARNPGRSGRRRLLDRAAAAPRGRRSREPRARRGASGQPPGIGTSALPCDEGPEPSPNRQVPSEVACQGFFFMWRFNKETPCFLTFPGGK